MKNSLLAPLIRDCAALPTNCAASRHSAASTSIACAAMPVSAIIGLSSQRTFSLRVIVESPRSDHVCTETPHRFGDLQAELALFGGFRCAKKPFLSAPFFIASRRCAAAGPAGAVNAAQHVWPGPLVLLHYSAAAVGV